MSGSVIKGGGADARSLGFSRLDLRDIRRQADDLLERAQADAERIVTEAYMAAEAHKSKVRDRARIIGQEEGLEVGRREGRQAALDEARKKFAEENKALVEMLVCLRDEWGDRRERLYQAARRDVIVLALAVVRRLWNGLEKMGPAACEAAAEACGAALEPLKNSTNVIIQAHPEDCAGVRNVAAELFARLTGSPDVQVVEDASVGRGGVVVRTADCTVDAGINARIERIADELLTDWRSRMKELSIQ